MMANDLRLKLNLLRCLLHPLSISLRPQQKTCTPYAARGAIVSKSPALFKSASGEPWADDHDGRRGVCPGLSIGAADGQISKKQPGNPGCFLFEKSLSQIDII